VNTEEISIIQLFQAVSEILKSGTFRFDKLTQPFLHFKHVEWGLRSKCVVISNFDMTNFIQP